MRGGGGEVKPCAQGCGLRLRATGALPEGLRLEGACAAGPAMRELVAVRSSLPRSACRSAAGPGGGKGKGILEKRKPREGPRPKGKKSFSNSNGDLRQFSNINTPSLRLKVEVRLTVRRRAPEAISVSLDPLAFLQGFG